MRTSGEVAQKLKQAAYRRMKRELTRLLRQAPENCTESRILKVRDEDVRFCRDDFQVCDRRLDDRSKDCEKFRCKHDKDHVKEEFQKFLRTADIPDIAIRFPDVAALMWVLNSGEDGEEEQRGALFPEGLLATTLFGIEIWADTPEERDKLQAHLVRLQTDAETLYKAQADLEMHSPAVVPEAIRILKGRIRLLEESQKESRAEISKVEERLEAAEAEARTLREQAEARRKAAEELAMQEVPEPSWWRKLWKS